MNIKSQLKKIAGFFFLFFFSMGTCLAQSSSEAVEMDDVFKTNGKIYVVVTVLSVVFIGLVIFLVNIDRKLARLEKKMMEKQ